MKLNMPNPPCLSLGPSHEGWSLTAYLQVGTRSYRHFEKGFTHLDDALEFIKSWVANWQAVALDVWDYNGLEDIEELPLPDGTLSGVLAALGANQPALKRRF